MYYSDEIIDQVRTANDIVDVIGQSVSLRRAGSNYMGLCPFHNEKTPSFSVSRQKQMYYCFGCHKGGNVLTFVEEYNNMDFTEAMQYLADRAGIRLPEKSGEPGDRRSGNERKELLEINKLAGTWYYSQLRRPSGKSGLDYLAGRGLSRETMQTFGLGFAPKTPSDGLYRFLKEKGITDAALKRSGLMNVDERRGNMYDKFWNRVIFPIMDPSNRIIGFGGRVMGDAKPKYLNSPETKVFDKSRNLYALNEARRTREDHLILCEGYMDVISMHQAGFTNAVASLGTSLTPGHCALLSRYKKKVLLSYDSDSAGRQAAMRAIPMLRKAGITPHILRLDPYKDPDELIRAIGPEGMKERIRDAQNALMFEAEVLRKEYDFNDPESRTEFFRQTAGRIASFADRMTRDAYIDRIAGEYQVDRSLLSELVTKELMLAPARPAREDTAQESAPDQPYDWPDDPAACYGASFYEDEQTGEMFQPPSAASRKNRSATLKEQGEEISRKLLLNYIVQYPVIFRTVARYVGAEDFGEAESLTGRLARLVFEQVERDGKADEAALLSRLQDTADQTQAAEVFHTMDRSATDTERSKAIAETLLKVYRAASPAGIGFAGVVERRRKEQEIGKLEFRA